MPLDPRPRLGSHFASLPWSAPPPLWQILDSPLATTVAYTESNGSTDSGTYALPCNAEASWIHKASTIHKKSYHHQNLNGSSFSHALPSKKIA